MQSPIPVAQTLTTVEKYRQSVHERFSKLIEDTDDYDQRDIQRFDDEDPYASMFIRHGQYANTFDERKALQYFHESMSWRMKNKVNDLTKSDFPSDYFQRHAIYFKNHDIDNNSIFYFALRTIIPDQEDMEVIQRFIIYQFEDYFKSHLGESIVILFDMSETGLKHLDYEFAKFLVLLTQIYYPGLVLYILIYKLPVILTSAWNIIRSWFPKDAQQTIKFVERESIVQYIRPDQIPILNFNK